MGLGTEEMQPGRRRGGEFTLQEFQGCYDDAKQTKRPRDYIATCVRVRGGMYIGMDIYSQAQLKC